MGKTAVPELMGVPLMVPLEEIERLAVAAPTACDNVAPKTVALLLAVMVYENGTPTVPFAEVALVISGAVSPAPLDPTAI
jgi:hypothetical protein